jgi:hypothetical protein
MARTRQLPDFTEELTVPKIPCPCCGVGQVELYHRDGVVWAYVRDNPNCTSREVHAATKVFNHICNTSIALNRLFEKGLLKRYRRNREKRRMWRYCVAA